LKLSCHLGASLGISKAERSPLSVPHFGSKGVRDLWANLGAQEIRDLRSEFYNRVIASNA